MQVFAEIVRNVLCVLSKVLTIALQIFLNCIILIAFIKKLCGFLCECVLFVFTWLDVAL